MTRTARLTLPALTLALLLGAAAAWAGADGAFNSTDRLLSAYFFWRGPWDETVVTSGGALGMSGTWKLTFPAPGQPMAAAYGLDSPKRWPGDVLPDVARWPATYKDPKQLPLWLMAEWRAMKWTGLDFVLLDDWHCLNFKPDLTPYPCFEALTQAWAELDRRGEKPLPLAMLLETPFAWYPPKDPDATRASKDDIAALWEPTRAFLRQFYGEKGYPARLPPRALARVMVNGEARPLVHYWFPTWVGAGFKKWDAWTFQRLRRKCKEAFGVEPFIGVNQHVYGPTCEGGWSSKQPGGGQVEISSQAGVVDYDVAWWGGMAGPQVYPNAIALGPGHWCPRQSGDKPVTLHSSPAYAPDKTRYESCWRKVLSNPDSFKRHLLIIESWNNSDEGCAIAYSQPQDFKTGAGALIDRWGDTPEYYMALTRELAPCWKQGRCPPRFAK